MAREVERYRPTNRQPTSYQDPPQQQDMYDPTQNAYQAGMELAQRMSGSDMVRPDDGDPFNHPFFVGGFTQGQTRREVKHKRTMHVISETEHILTEETTTTETLSFGNDIYQK